MLKKYYAKKSTVDRFLSPVYTQNYNNVKIEIYLKTKLSSLLVRR